VGQTSTLSRATPLSIPHGNGENSIALKKLTSPASGTGSAEPPGVSIKKPRFTVLVIDDELPLRSLMMRTLEARGIDPIGAADGAEGLKAFLASRESIDLVILDLLMPGMSGLDLAAELERRRPGLKILYISGLGASIAMDSIVRESADRVMLKPFTQQALLERVEHLLAMDKVRSTQATRRWSRETA
jgi:DNA-binding response OmpR family regulator